MVRGGQNTMGRGFNIPWVGGVKIPWYFDPSQWFSPGTQVSSTNKTDCHNITEILLKMELNTINKQTNLIFQQIKYLML
jgi:hypothetical protein